MDSVFLHGTSAAGIAVYELHLAKAVYAILSVVIVNLLTAILLEMVVDVSLKVVAIVNHHTAGRAIDNLVESVIVVSVQENSRLGTADEILASLHISDKRLVFFLATSTPADGTEVPVVPQMDDLVRREPFKKLVELGCNILVHHISVVISYGYELN
jgi:hypothetical protein